MFSLATLASKKTRIGARNVIWHSTSKYSQRLSRGFKSNTVDLRGQRLTPTLLFFQVGFVIEKVERYIWKAENDGYSGW